LRVIEVDGGQKLVDPVTRARVVEVGACEGANLAEKHHRRRQHVVEPAVDTPKRRHKDGAIGRSCGRQAASLQFAQRSNTHCGAQ
jgi:hypothetical protein